MVRQAVEAVLENRLSIAQATKQICKGHVCPRTVRRAVDKARLGKSYGSGNQQALKPEWEEHLVGLVEELSCDAIQITQGALCSLAWLLLEALKNGKKRQHLSSNAKSALKSGQKKKRLSTRWAEGFLLRHPEVCYNRKPKVTDSARVNACTEKNASNFLHLFDKTLAEEGFLDDSGVVVDPRTIVNLDEKPCRYSAKAGPTLYMKGKSSGVAGSEDKRTLTLTQAIGLDGSVYRPQLLFSKRGNSETLSSTNLPDTLECFIQLSKCGFQTGETLRKWLPELLEEIRRSHKMKDEEKVLLLLDQHSSRGKPLVRTLSELHCVIVFIPGKTSTLLQPADKVFHLLDQKYSQRLLELTHTNDLQKLLKTSQPGGISNDTFCEVLQRAVADFHDQIRGRIAREAWKACGIAIHQRSVCLINKKYFLSQSCTSTTKPLDDSPQKTRKDKRERVEQDKEAATQVKLLCRNIRNVATEGNKQPKKQRRKTSISFKAGVAITNEYVDTMEKTRLQADERVKEEKAKLAQEKKDRKFAEVQKHQLTLETLRKETAHMKEEKKNVQSHINSLKREGKTIEKQEKKILELTKKISTNKNKMNPVKNKTQKELTSHHESGTSRLPAKISWFWWQQSS